eukprot:1486581-Rhodomonas_salina.2
MRLGAQPTRKLSSEAFSLDDLLEKNKYGGEAKSAKNAASLESLMGKHRYPHDIDVGPLFCIKANRCFLDGGKRELAACPMLREYAGRNGRGGGRDEEAKAVLCARKLTSSDGGVVCAGCGQYQSGNRNKGMLQVSFARACPPPPPRSLRPLHHSFHLLSSSATASCALQAHVGARRTCTRRAPRAAFSSCTGHVPAS